MAVTTPTKKQNGLRALKDTVVRNSSITNLERFLLTVIFYR
jgi:hypothetical protein